MNIAYTLVGMTRGHASRALAVGGELIERGHDVRFYTNLDAYELLTKRFGFDRVKEIDMPKYIFSNGKISLFRTILQNSGFVFRREKYTQPIIASFDKWMPDVTVSDFEPLAWWISQKLRIPHITLDSQRFMISSEMPKRLPLSDNIQRLLMWLLLYSFSPFADKRIVSKAFAIPTETASENYVGAITRKKLDQLHWKPARKHFVVYIKESLCDRLREIQVVAKETGLTGKVYGIPAHHLLPYKELEHVVTCEDTFLHDLSSCEFAIITPGSQTLAETWSLGIPAYLLPEPNQFEQQINLHLARQAAPYQYAKFISPRTLKDNPLKGRGLKSCTSYGRKRVVDIIESLQAPS